MVAPGPLLMHAFCHPCAGDSVRRAEGHESRVVASFRAWSAQRPAAVVAESGVGEFSSLQGTGLRLAQRVPHPLQNFALASLAWLHL